MYSIEYIFFFNRDFPLRNSNKSRNFALSNKEEGEKYYED